MSPKGSFGSEGAPSLFGILVAIARGEAKRRGSRTSILTGEPSGVRG